MAKQQRQHFRIDYPINDRASVHFGKKKYPILDISQKGIKFLIEGQDTPDAWEVSKAYKGTVHFLIGKQQNINGKVIRVTEQDTTLHLDEAIPLGVMNEEHRHIIKTFNRLE